MLLPFLKLIPLYATVGIQTWNYILEYLLGLVLAYFL